MLIDILCSVIDNYGDIAVVWRLTKSLLETAGGDLKIRLIVDDLVTFHSLCAEVDPAKHQQKLESNGVEVFRTGSLPDLGFYRERPADVLIEAFGVQTPDCYLEALKTAAALVANLNKTKIIVHLEYLTAETWAVEYHKLPSPQPWLGIQKFFFVPGLRKGTGGVILEKDFIRKVTNAGTWGSLERGQWRDRVFHQLGLPADERTFVVTLFSYEHDYTHFWLDLHDFMISQKGRIYDRALVVVFEGRQKEGALRSLSQLESGKQGDRIEAFPLPFLEQESYDDLILAGDFHVVRGEESWMRAVLGGKAHLWHAYLQPEGYQSVKVDAFLEVLEPWFEREPHGSDIFFQFTKELRAFNARTVNDANEAPAEHYRFFFEHQRELETIFSNFSGELAKNLDLSQLLLDFLRGFRV